MPAERRPGYDHPHFPFDAFVDRDTLRFDRPATTVAVVPLVLLEFYEDPVPAWPQLASLGGGLDRTSPNISRLSTREYGHRVGIFRMVESMTERGLRPTVAIDVQTAETYPFLVRWLTDRDVQWVAHGEAVTRPLGAHLSREDEAEYVEQVLSRLHSSGVVTDGWLGPEYGESPFTPEILAEQGVRYVLDWSCDEQPFLFHGQATGLIGLPTYADLDDQTSLINRMLDPVSYSQHLVDAVSRLAEDGRDTARVLTFCVRPWLLGQPFRAWMWDGFLDACLQRDGAWVTTPSEALDALGHRKAIT